MEGRTIYAGPDGLARVKVNMVMTWRQRKRGSDVGYSSEYSRGMVAGLALVDALDAAVPFGVAPFITDRRYAVESPTPDKQGNTVNNPPRPKAHGLTSDVPEHLLEVFQQTRRGILGERAPRPDAGAARGGNRADDRDRGLRSRFATAARGWCRGTCCNSTTGRPLKCTAIFLVVSSAGS
jgi:hypothetical protein